jgi:16S rRNA (cytosine1402-N4)-methyltransferase
MPDQVLQGLNVRPDGTYLDGTYGRGGHAGALLARLSAHGRLLVMDKDPAAIADARARFAADPRVAVRHASFAELDAWDATAAGLDGVLFDLGVSSPQLDVAERGFSFANDGPLDMRMDPGRGESAADFLARADADEIADVLWRYGEERQSRRIAKAIVLDRATTPFTRTAELAGLLLRLLGRGDAGKHPATRTFQALRIHVNRELDDLDAGLAAAAARLRPGGRLAVISFHSLEDRAVKHFIRGERAVAPRRGLPPPAVAAAPLVAVGRAIQPDDAEIERNPRSRSAVLRLAEKPA